MQVGPRHTLNSYEIEKYKQAVSSGKVQRSMPISLRVTHAEDQCIAAPQYLFMDVDNRDPNSLQF